MKNVIVKTQALKKYYQTGNQTVRALDGVNFEVAEREFVSIVGKSGSGKSTLLHMIGGLDTPSSGTVIVDGLNLETLNSEQLALFRRRKVGFIFQQYNLIPDLNVYDNITFPLELDGTQIDKDFIQELLETLNISDKQEMNYMEIPFNVPVIPLISAIILVMLICMITPLLSYKKLAGNRSIVERLRDYE